MLGGAASRPPRRADSAVLGSCCLLPRPVNPHHMMVCMLTSAVGPGHRAAFTGLASRPAATLAPPAAMRYCKGSKLGLANSAIRKLEKL